MAGPCPGLNSDRGTLIINKSWGSYSQWIPLGMNLLGAAPTPDLAPHSWETPRFPGGEGGERPAQRNGGVVGTPCLGTPLCPPREVQLMRGEGKGRWETPPPGHGYTPQQFGQGTERSPVPQLCPGGPQEAPELPRCPWCPPVVQGFKEGSDGTPLSPGGYRMTQGGRLLVIFSRGSPLRALRMASIS